MIVSVDRLVLREAVTNVLDNAIKYGPDGATIAIRVERIGNRGLLAVADEGPGIPSEHRERVFHRFFRVDEARSRERGGAGLGLAIAKWAVDIHGGQITVDCPPSRTAGPLIIGGALKIGYDLLLYRAFRHVRPPEEDVVVSPRAGVHSGV